MFNLFLLAGPSGEVLVYPGSIFHIDCLFDRRKGNPDWKTANPVKRYPTGIQSSYQLLCSSALKIRKKVSQYTYWLNSMIFLKKIYMNFINS